MSHLLILLLSDNRGQFHHDSLPLYPSQLMGKVPLMVEFTPVGVQESKEDMADFRRQLMANRKRRNTIIYLLLESGRAGEAGKYFILGWPSSWQTRENFRLRCQQTPQR